MLELVWELAVIQYHLWYDRSAELVPVLWWTESEKQLLTSGGMEIDIAGPDRGL